MQADGKILVGGDFRALGGQARNKIGRLNADGSLDSAFNPGADYPGYSLALQPDGKILVGGYFTTLGGQPCHNIGRLNADGSLDSSFNPETEGNVLSIAVQADGKILVGGDFMRLGGQPRNFIGRLNADGSLDNSFNPGADSSVYSLAVQADGKILVGGGFMTLGGQPRNFIGRLNADGSLDSSFNPEPDSYVVSLAVQADGRILVGGIFARLGGQQRNCIGRLNSTTLATQTLSYDGSSITWLRGGLSPEVYRTTFDFSTNGVDWASLGAGSRLLGVGWLLTNVSLPADSTIRARGYVTVGQQGGSAWFVETLLSPGGSTPPRIVVDDGRLGFGTNGFGFNLRGTAGQAVVVEGSSNLFDWLPLQTNTLGSDLFYWSDPAAAGKVRQFYRARLSP